MINRIQGKLTEEEITYMLEINPELELVSKKILIDLSRHSYPSTYSSCLPACCVMAFCYWQDHLPQLGITTSRDYWEVFINKCSSGTIKGVNLPKIRMNLQPEYRKFIISERTLKNFSDLIPPFYAWKFPLIQVIIFDRIYSYKERTGGGHAAIISQVNMQEKSLLLIDPMNYNDENIIIESHMHMRDLAKGWKPFSNLVIWIHPKNLLRFFNVKTGKATVTKSFKQEKINKYISLY